LASDSPTADWRRHRITIGGKRGGWEACRVPHARDREGALRELAKT
jgi:hypothetical protein